MPCLLKQRTDKSPGVIVFTQNEVIWGITHKSKKVRDFLINSSNNNSWIYGIHIQGDLSWMGGWPLEQWQSFIMWPDVKANFLSNVPPEKILNLNCIQFMTSSKGSSHPSEKPWDLCVISRASGVKRIKETLYLIREMLTRYPKLKVVFIVPDSRKMNSGGYRESGIDYSFFELPRQLFSSKELKNITFISSSVEAFGTFPVTPEFIRDTLRKSKFLLLTSKSEGTPKVIIEAFLEGTPCILSRELRCGMRDILNEKNTLFIDDDVDLSSNQVIDALNSYSRFTVETKDIERQFCAQYHEEPLKDYLSKQILSRNRPVDGKWYLEDFPNRLSGHGLKYSFQFMYSEDLFFHWLDRSEKGDPYDEDAIFSTTTARDVMSISQRFEQSWESVMGSTSLFKRVLRKLR